MDGVNAEKKETMGMGMGRKGSVRRKNRAKGEEGKKGGWGWKDI